MTEITYAGVTDNFHFSDRPKQIEMIRDAIREGMERNPLRKPKQADERYDCADDLFEIRCANEWMDVGCRRPPPKMLFDNFWFENELCILFADTNVGKSILAVQLGNCLANGNDIEPFKTETAACPVLYVDFEQSAAQFEARYTVYDGPYKFSPRFFRAELNAAAGHVRNYIDRVHYCIEEGLRKTGAKVLIIDNLTYLANQAGQIGDALSMMKFLKTIKSKYHISILALAHTPKRNQTRPITNNDMHGSKMLINFCDSAFAMGRSQKNSNIRYLKQIKQRNSSEVYGEGRVCLFTIERSGGLLRLCPAGYEPEHEHLQKANYITIADRQAAKKMFSEGLSKRQIALQLDIARSTVRRILEEEENG
ncbi:AAA family ATPase [Mucilaginibacter ginkgonis]|uniref:AAA family ATPase n=1 Tax=Mucilaginibacter ginkgonis TaxID=2682091 RepID=A0A6I4I437_9SPHI|nr:AAA family ATPase [Mucilaginibacter ginkgonis]QQL48822.1 AAA family ATPase [Mucilaginibacter ginkgonis]